MGSAGIKQPQALKQQYRGKCWLCKRLTKVVYLREYQPFNPDEPTIRQYIWLHDQCANKPQRRSNTRRAMLGLVTRYHDYALGNIHQVMEIGVYAGPIQDETGVTAPDDCDNLPKTLFDLEPSV